MSETQLMRELIESEKSSQEISEFMNEDIDKQALKKIEGKTVKRWIVLNSGMAKITFEDGTVLEFFTDTASLK